METDFPLSSVSALTIHLILMGSEVSAEIPILRAENKENTSDSVSIIKEINQSDKLSKNSHTETPNLDPIPQGQKPDNISDDLFQFLSSTGWNFKKICSRFTITTHICYYIRDHHLYNENDKRVILCDDKLSKLLYHDVSIPLDKDGKPKVLNYFRLQHYLSPHIAKQASSHTKTPKITSLLLSRVFIVRENDFGNYEHKQTGFLFNPDTERVYGNQKTDGTVTPLTAADIKLCNLMNFDLEQSDEDKRDEDESDDEEENEENDEDNNDEEPEN